MPADRKQQKAKCHACDTCGRPFVRPADLRRHKKLHEEGEREYLCPHENCKFSAHQKGNLKTHFNSQHKGIRLPCGEADCNKTFTDPSSRSKHRTKFHHIVEEAFASSPVPIPVHKRVIRHVEENSPDKAQEILGQFSAFTVESLGMPDPSAPSMDFSPSSSNAVCDEPSAPSPSTAKETLGQFTLGVPTPSDLSAPSTDLPPLASPSNAVSDEPSAPSRSTSNYSHASQLPPSNVHAPGVQTNSGVVYQSKFLHESTYDVAGTKPAWTLSPATFE